MIKFAGATALPIGRLPRRAIDPTKRKKFSLGRRRTREERQLGLLPSTIWLYDYVLKPSLRRGGCGWMYVPLTYIAQRPGAPSRSALQRAMNQLQEREEVFGIEISLLWKDGRPQLLVAAQDWLKFDRRALHFWDKAQTENRHLRSRCRSRDFIDLDLEATHCLNNAPKPSSVSKETAAVNIETSSNPDLSTRFAPRKLGSAKSPVTAQKAKLQRLARHLVALLRSRHSRPGNGFDGHRVYGMVIQLLREGRKKYRILESFSFHWRTTTTSKPETKVSLVTWKMRSRDFPWTRSETTRKRIADLQHLLGTRLQPAPPPLIPKPLTPLEEFTERINAPRSGPGPGELAALWIDLSHHDQEAALAHLTPLTKERLGRALVLVARFRKPDLDPTKWTDKLLSTGKG